MLFLRNNKNNMCVSGGHNFAFIILHFQERGRYMNPLHRARRVGCTAVLCAALLRLFAAGLPQKLYTQQIKPNIDALLQKQETGRDVRFSSSIDTFTPDFMESPPPSLPEVIEIPLPTFSGTEDVDLYYAVKKQPDIAALLARPLAWDLRGDTPSVLILHTHTTESYTRKGEDYRESASWRTLDKGYNMVSIGVLVGQILEENGIRVLHHKELNDYPSYNGSYTRARKTMRELLKEHPQIRLVLDLHRDAAGDEKNQMRTLAEVNGQPSAQRMLVVGTNHGAYEENLSLALKLHAQLETQAEGIMRPLQLRAQRFNQDLSPGALLIEVGAAGNSHPEARLAAEELAKAIVALARGTESNAKCKMQNAE